MTWQPLLSLPTITLVAVLWLLLCWFGIRKVAPNGQRPPGSVVAFLRRAGLGLVLVVALLGPAVPTEQTEVTTNVEILFAIDRTGSMAAEDWEDQRPRLDGVKRDVELLVEATAGSRFSVVTWDAVGRLELPVTTDSSAVLTLTELLHQEISEFSTGSSLDRPVTKITEVLANAQERRPQNVRYLILFSDGETTAETTTQMTTESGGDVAETWRVISPFIDGGGIIGYGTPEGAPMRVYQPGQGPLEEYMTVPDTDGQMATSTLDEASLRAVSEALGMPLLVNPTADEVTRLGEELMSHSKLVEEGRGVAETPRYLIWPLGLLGSVLLVWEAAIFVRTLLELRRSHAL